MVTTLGHFRQGTHHIVPQVIETKLVISTIRDVCGVCLLTGHRTQMRQTDITVGLVRVFGIKNK